MSQARAQMRARFLARASERLVALGNVLLAIESHPNDPALVDQIMREIHTLKGEAKLMQLAQINAVAHETEGLIMAAHTAGLARSLDAVEHLFAGFDVMRQLVELEQGSEGKAPDVQGICARLQLAAAQLSARAANEAGSGPPEVTAASVPRAEPQSVADTDWLFRSAAHMRVDPVRLDELGKVSAQLLLNQQALERSVAALTKRVESLTRELETVETLVTRVGAPSVARRELLERALTGIARRVRTWPEARRAARDESRAARDRVFQTGIAQDELQARLRELRLQPVGSLFERFPRAARDLALAQGKRVRVEVKDADLGVDKRVLERLAEPLLHLVRNAIDHGIEKPEARQLAGKPPLAHLRLSAEQVGSAIDLIVEDDGRGIDPGALRGRAIELGLLPASTARELSDADAMQLVFRPGFSTRTTTTDISGRGVGLDVVARTMADLGGSVRLESKLGVGTRFVLIVPGSVLLKPVLVARIGGQEFGFAAQRVSRVVRLSEAEVEPTGTHRVLRMDGQRMVLGDLGPMLGIAADAEGERSAIVISASGRTAAFAVDDVIGQAQVLQRPIGAFMAGHALLDGVAITESGSAILLLSGDRLVEMLDSRSAFTTRESARSRTHHSVLVVDDSEVTRELVSSILRSEGFEVIEAVNGRDALERLRTNRPSVVLSDLEMPVLDGLGLLAEIRKSAEFSDLPVVMFTTRGSEADRRRGAEAGASAYLVKGNFDEQELVSTVRRFLKAEAAT